MPARVGRHRRIDPERNEAQVGGGDLPLDRVAARVSVGRDLLEMGDLCQVDLCREMAPDRRLEGLVGGEHSAWQRPRAGERVARALPEQRLEDAVSYLEDGCERDLS